MIVKIKIKIDLSRCRHQLTTLSAQWGSPTTPKLAECACSMAMSLTP